jgi:hypothetical protein
MRISTPSVVRDGGHDWKRELRTVSRFCSRAESSHASVVQTVT